MNDSNRQKNIAKSRFFACADGARLLHILQRAVVRPTVGGIVSRFHSFAGDHPNCRYTLGSDDKNNLKRCGIFRGKVLQRQNQKQKQHLE
jgi:hypothetical protein